MCKLVYQMDIQIYEQISIMRNCSKVKLYRVVSLGLGLKGIKIIAQNVAKFGMQDCLSNGHPNLWSSFHYKKYVKSEPPSYSFVRVWLKGAENNSNHLKAGVYTYHPNAHQKIWSNFNSNKFVKSETLSCSFVKVGLKGVKIAQNVMKVGVHACLSNWHPNLWSNFDCEKFLKSETSSCIFTRVQLKAGPNSSKHCKIWRACLYIKWASKSMIKFQFREFGLKWNSVTRFR